jgi:hypothetical protein
VRHEYVRNSIFFNFEKNTRSALNTLPAAHMLVRTSHTLWVITYQWRGTRSAWAMRYE